jgi:hypothetical protein
MIDDACGQRSLGEAARRSFEMLPQGQRFMSETQRRSFAEGEAKGRSEGEAKGRSEGEAKGRSEGEAKGEAKGRSEGEARAILRVLERRGLPVSSEQRSRVLSCADLTILEAWLDRAVTAASIDEVFVEADER